MEDLDVIDMLPGPLFIPADWLVLERHSQPLFRNKSWPKSRDSWSFQTATKLSTFFQKILGFLGAGEAKITH
jgi:hypothetical protein